MTGGGGDGRNFGTFSSLSSALHRIFPFSAQCEGKLMTEPSYQTINDGFPRQHKIRLEINLETT